MPCLPRLGSRPISPGHWPLKARLILTLTLRGPSSMEPARFLGVSMHSSRSMPRSMEPNTDFLDDLQGVSRCRCILSSSVSTEPPALKHHKHIYISSQHTSIWLTFCKKNPKTYCCHLKIKNKANINCVQRNAKLNKSGQKLRMTRQ